MAENKKFYNIWIALIGIFILGGLFTTFKIVTEGHGILSSTDMLVWTMPIATYVFLALMSSGFTQMASFPDVFGLEKYQKLARRFSFLALATLIAAFLALSLELGSLFKLVYFIISPNIYSPIWWMGVIYLVELAFIMAKLLKKGSPGKSVNALNVLSSGVSILAPLMLGAIFSMFEARPVFYGLFLPVFFLVIAFLSGIAMAIFRKQLYIYFGKEQKDLAAEEIFEQYGKAFEFALGITILFYAMRLVFKSTTLVEAFSTEVYLLPFIMLIFAFVLRKIPTKIPNKNNFASASLALLGVFGFHMELLFDGQAKTIGVRTEIAAEVAPYWSNPWEWLIFLFALGVMFLLYTLGEKYLDLKGA